MSSADDEHGDDSPPNEPPQEVAVAHVITPAENPGLVDDHPPEVAIGTPTAKTGEDWELSPGYKRVWWVTNAVIVVMVIIALGIGLYQYLQYVADQNAAAAVYNKNSAAISAYDTQSSDTYLAESTLSKAKTELSIEQHADNPDSRRLEIFQNDVNVAQAAYDQAENALEELRGADDKAWTEIQQLEDAQTDPIVRIVIAGVLIVIGYFVAVLIVTAIRSESKRAWQNRQLVAAIPYSTDLSPKALWQKNEEYLQRYHQLVQNYSTSTRQLTLIVILAEFVFLLAVGAVFMFITVTSTAIAASIVAAVFAGVTGFVANVVLKNAEGSSREVRQFFRHPIDVQRLLSAQLIIEDMDGAEKDKARMVIVRSLANVSESDADRPTNETTN